MVHFFSFRGSRSPVYDLVAAGRLEPAHALQIEQSLRTLRPRCGSAAGAAGTLLDALQQAINTCLLDWPRTAAPDRPSDYFCIDHAATIWTRQAGFDRIATAIDANL